MGAAPACDLLRRDHRAMENFLDRLLEIFSRPEPGQIPGIRAMVQEVRQLAAVHFTREETIFYPSLRPAFPELLGEMDRQHADIRELEQHVASLLFEPPIAPDARWLDELRSFGLEWLDRIQHHIVAEEDDLLRLAEQRLTRDVQERLAAGMIAVQPAGSAPSE